MATQRPASAALPSAIKTAAAPFSPYSKALLPLSPVARTPGADTWNIEAFAPEEPDKSTMRSTMRSRKTKSPPPTWLVNSVAPPTTMDTSGPHMKAHIQSLAKLDKEELAEKLFHAKMALSNLEEKNKLAQVENRKLEATLAKSTAGATNGASNAGTICSTARAKSYSPVRGKRAAAGDIVRNLKSKNKDLRVERDRALKMVAHLQRATRVAKLQELQAQVGVLKDEVAQQMALQHGSNGVPSTMARAASPMNPFANSRNGFRPAPGPSGATSKRRLTEVLQELYNATKPLQQEAEKLREACSIVSSADFASEPQYRAAAKVHSFLMDHVLTMADHISNMPCAERLTAALREMGLVESQRQSDERHAVCGQPLNLMTPELAHSGLKQGNTLAASLATLAPAFAAAVAHMESITVRELEADSWLKDGATKVAYMSQKFLECDVLQQRNSIPGPPSEVDNRPKTSALKHSGGAESGATGQETIPLTPVGSMTQLPPVAAIPTATPELSMQPQSSQLQRQESHLGSQASLPPARTSSLAQRLQDRLAAATSTASASQCAMDSGSVCEESNIFRQCSVGPLDQASEFTNSSIPAELDTASVKQKGDTSDTMLNDMIPESDGNVAEKAVDASETWAVTAGSIQAPVDNCDSPLPPQSSSSALHSATVTAEDPCKGVESEECTDIGTSPAEEVAHPDTMPEKHNSDLAAIEPCATASDVHSQLQLRTREAAVDPVSTVHEAVTGPAQLAEAKSIQGADRDVADSAPPQAQMSVGILPDSTHSSSLKAQEQETLPLPAPSLAASELQAVDSAIDHLLSIEEDSVCDWALSRQPTLIEKTTEQAGKDDDPPKVDSQNPGACVTGGGDQQPALSGGRSTQDSLGSLTAEHVLHDIVDDLALETNSMEGE